MCARPAESNLIKNIKWLRRNFKSLSQDRISFFGINLDFLSPGSGATCGDVSNDRYCGQKLNPTTDSKLNIPICGK
jgi:hypothetical protein